MHIGPLWLVRAEKVLYSTMPVLHCLRVGRSIDRVQVGSIETHYQVTNGSTLNVVSLKQQAVTWLRGTYLSLCVNSLRHQDVPVVTGVLYMLESFVVPV